ncbi:MAG: PAS domain S-box protein [Melioribacter sp.]|uniref:sensor histidine kinase n=1 Tax=Rosettibacter primus TaxID=3111523 RepID=UPI00247B68EA|nr:PAS domain S-box protein [Melioribacter sp.]
MKNFLKKILRNKNSFLNERAQLCEERNKLILKNLNGIAYQIDVRHPQITFMEGNVEELTGYSVEEFMSGKKFWIDIVYSEDVNKFLNEAKNLALSDNYTADNEYRIVHKNGNIVWIKDIATTFKDDKKIIHGILYDITHYKEKEEKLELVSYSVDNARIPIVWVGSKGEFLYANKAACKSLEYSEEEILKMTVFDIDPNIKRENWEEHWQKTLEKNSYVFETIHRSKSGREYPVEIFVDTIKYKGQYIHADIVNDISERKKYEQQLIEAKERAEVSDRLKTAFLSQMSHEIRSPLQKILGFVELIKEYIELTNNYVDPEIYDYYTLINLSSRRLIRTIDTILNMSEMHTNSYTPIFVERDLYSLIYDIYQEFKHDASVKKLDFRFESSTNNSKIRIDEYSTIQIFENLIDNAIKYTDKGFVKISIGRDARNNLYAEISDSGIGMTKEFMDKLFFPFNQEEIGYTRTYEGLGLGLALVKKYCDLNNAIIEVKSEKGIGTTIRVTFQIFQSGNSHSINSYHTVVQNKL